MDDPVVQPADKIRRLKWTCSCLNLHQLPFIHSAGWTCHNTSQVGAFEPHKMSHDLKEIAIQAILAILIYFLALIRGRMDR